MGDNQGPDGKVSAYVYGLGLTAAVLLAAATVALNNGPIQCLFVDELIDPRADRQRNRHPSPSSPGSNAPTITADAKPRSTD